MPWVDTWSVYVDNNSRAVTVMTGQAGQPEPPVGNGWLHTEPLPTNFVSSVNLVAKTPLPHASLQGMLRSIIRVPIMTLDGRAGLLCLQDRENMTYDSNSGVGKAYGAMIYSTGTELRLRLMKFTRNLWQATTLAETPPLVGKLNVNFTLGLSWDATASVIAQLGGPILSAYLGTALDYSDLAPAAPCVDIVDLTSPYTTTFGEGPACAGNSGFHAYFDQTQLMGP